MSFQQPVDDYDHFMRALEAERRHARPEWSKRLLRAAACGEPMSPGELTALVDEVTGTHSLTTEAVA